MNFINNLFSTASTDTKKILLDDKTPKIDNIFKLTIYITSIEDWENYYINMYDLQFILKKDHPKVTEFLKLLKVGKTVNINAIKEFNQYNILDISISGLIFELDTVITSITTDDDINTIINTIQRKIYLNRSNMAYCSIYNELKLNIPCCLMVQNSQLIGISPVKTRSDKIEVRGLININIEFPHLIDYYELIPSFKSIISYVGRIVYQKGQFEFKIGCNYTLTYQKMCEKQLYKIIESTEI
jgi:hypothetical protein